MRSLLSFTRTLLLTVVFIHALGTTASASVLFDFESSSANTAAPFTITVGGAQRNVCW